MKILGVDPGYAKCGWAVIDSRTATIIDLGVIVTSKDKRLDVTTDRSKRIAIVAHELATLAALHDCTRIAAEQPLGHGAAAAVAANMLPWGALVMLAVVRGASLVSVTAKTWQRAVLDLEEGKVDYDLIEDALSHYVGGKLLRGVAKGDRTHACDGAGVGLLASLRPHLAIQIIERRAIA